MYCARHRRVHCHALRRRLGATVLLHMSWVLQSCLKRNSGALLPTQSSRTPVSGRHHFRLCPAYQAAVLRHVHRFRTAWHPMPHGILRHMVSRAAW